MLAALLVVCALHRGHARRRRVLRACLMFYAPGHSGVFALSSCHSCAGSIQRVCRVFWSSCAGSIERVFRRFPASCAGSTQPVARCFFGFNAPGPSKASSIHAPGPSSAFSSVFRSHAPGPFKFCSRLCWNAGARSASRRGAPPEAAGDAVNILLLARLLIFPVLRPRKRARKRTKTLACSLGLEGQRRSAPCDA